MIDSAEQIDAICGEIRTEAGVAQIRHPFVMTGDTVSPCFGRQHVVEKNIVGEDDDLTAGAGFFGQTRCDSLHTVVIE